MTLALWCARDVWGDIPEGVLRTPSDGSSQRVTASSTEAVTDAEYQLITRVSAGDRDAFDRLAERHWDALWRYAFRLRQSADAADDLTQETLFALWRHRTQLDPVRGVRGYIFGTMRRQALALRRHEQVVHRAAMTHDPVVVAGVASPDSDRNAPHEYHALATALARVLATLPEARREVLVLRWWHGLTYDEIATALGMSTSAVKMQVHRTIAAIRPQLERAWREWQEASE